MTKSYLFVATIKVSTYICARLTIKHNFKMKKVILGLASAAVLVACGGETKSDVPVANSNDTTTTETQEANKAAASEAISYGVVDSSSVLNWKGSAVGKEHFGTVDYKGSVQVADGKLVGGELVFDLSTIDSKDLEGEWKQKLDGHLMSPDFFNVDSFPTASLVINGYEGGNVKGDLTIKGVTKAISFPGEVKVTESGVEASAKFQVNRTEYGIVYGSGNFFDLAKDKVISDDIEFDVKIVAAK